ncbi:D-alanyl-D-alanine carboxypeptidase [Candidatus Uhrbacteria bacterium]|nr:D-alanyl-D-alanine carboxypeptidase [Candidatus Uhrbacteria bacterium]
MFRLLFLIVLLSIALAGTVYMSVGAYPFVLPLRASSRVDETRNQSSSLVIVDGTRDARIGPRLSPSARSVPEISADHAVIVDGDTGAILYGKGDQTAQPIASLTKLMTALVVLDTAGLDFERPILLEYRDDRVGGTLFVRRGESVRVRDLFFTSLVGSANNATMALARATGLSPEEFVEAMNARARILGLQDTTFVEPTGLDPRNVSTARDIARLAWHAFQNPRIREAVTTSEYVFRTVNTGVRHRIKNTDELLRTRGRSYTIVGGKTGYIDEAGFCLAVEAERGAKRVIALVLGSKSHADRFRDVDALIEWAMESYEWNEKVSNSAATAAGN